MAQAAQKQERHPASPAPVATGTGGGAIGDMQRTIEERMTMDASWAAASTALATAEAQGISHRLSRLAGPVLLAVGYAAVAAWWL